MSAKKRNLSTALERAKLFADEFNLQIPILLAPMPNATPPELVKKNIEWRRYGCMWSTFYGSGGNPDMGA